MSPYILADFVEAVVILLVVVELVVVRRYHPLKRMPHHDELHVLTRAHILWRLQEVYMLVEAIHFLMEQLPVRVSVEEE